MRTPSLCHPDRPQVSKVLRCCAGCYNNLKYSGDYRRAAVRRSRYKITNEEFERERQEQHNRCAICRTEFGTRNPCVDHDHETDVRRGLLCDLCNKGLGQFKDSVALLTAAVRYLENYHGKTKAEDEASGPRS